MPDRIPTTPEMNWWKIALSAACGMGLVVVAQLHNGWVAVVCTVVNGAAFALAEAMGQESDSLEDLIAGRPRRGREGMKRPNVNTVFYVVAMMLLVIISANGIRAQKRYEVMVDDAIKTIEARNNEIMQLRSINDRLNEEAMAAGRPSRGLLVAPNVARP